MAVIVREGFISVAGSTVPIFNYDQLEQIRIPALRSRTQDMQKLLDLAGANYDPAPAHTVQRIKWILKQQEVLISIAAGARMDTDEMPMEEVPEPLKEPQAAPAARQPAPFKGRPERARSPIGSEEAQLLSPRGPGGRNRSPQLEQPVQGARTPVWPGPPPDLRRRSPMPDDRARSPIPDEPARPRSPLLDQFPNRRQGSPRLDQPAGRGNPRERSPILDQIGAQGARPPVWPGQPPDLRDRSPEPEQPARRPRSPLPPEQPARPRTRSPLPEQPPTPPQRGPMPLQPERPRSPLLEPPPDRRQRQRSPVTDQRARPRSPLPEEPARGARTPVWPQAPPQVRQRSPDVRPGTVMGCNSFKFDDNLPVGRATVGGGSPFREKQGRQFDLNLPVNGGGQKKGFNRFTEFQLEQLNPNRLHQKCTEIRECLEATGQPFPTCPASRLLRIRWAMKMQERLVANLGVPEASAAGMISERQTGGPLLSGRTMAERNLQFSPPPRGGSPRQPVDALRGPISGGTQWFDLPEAPPSEATEPSGFGDAMPLGKMPLNTRMSQGHAAASIRGTMRRRGAPTLGGPLMPGVKRQDLLQKKTGNPHVHYNFVKNLGEGSFGVTSLVIHKHTKQERCLKTVNKLKAHVPSELLEAEFQALALIDHPHVIKLFEYWEDNSNCYFVTEAYKGGTLLDVIEEHRKKRTPIAEEWLAEVFQQILEGINYCHSRNLIHKDLKAENIMLLEKQSDESAYGVHAVVIDLGLSECFTITDSSSEVAGTPITMAPELWRVALGQGTFGTKCDIYSLGCVLFRMLSSAGIPPIIPAGRGEPQDWLQAIRRGPNWLQLKTASPEAKDLTKKMLTYNEDQRPDAFECLGHEWFAKMKENSEDLGLRTVHYQALLSHRHQQRTPFHKNVLMKVASQLGAAELRDVNAVFRRYDSDHSGTLTVDEVVSLLRDLGVTEEAAVEAAREMDVSQDGTVDYTEFVTACVSHRKASLRELLQQAFEEYDLNQDGHLSREEIRAILLGDKMNNQFQDADGDVEAIIDELDFDSYGSIDLEEFTNFFIPAQ